MSSADHPEFYRVVVNREECYGIWPTEVAVPPGWASIGFAGPGEAALNQVAELWRMACSRRDHAGPGERTKPTDE